MKDIRALTGLRGIAAIVVFLAHTRENLEFRGLELPVAEVVKRLFLSGGRQVDIFFVLSGFILAMIYHSWFERLPTGKRYVQFLWRRIARIYPLHAFILVMVLLFVTLAQLTHAHTVNGLDRYTLSSLPAHFLLVHAWGFLGPQGGYWNPPSWSISIEALAYLLFPLIIWLTAGIARSKPLLLFALVAAAGLACNYSTYWGLAGWPGIARGISEFTLGCATFSLAGSQLAQWLRTNSGSLAAAAALLVCFALTPDTGIVIGLATAPLLLALCGDNGVSRMVGSLPIWFLGEISYSIYLGHFLFSSLAYRLISVEWMKTGTTPLVAGSVGIFVLVLVLSTLTYYLVERPARNLLRG